MGDKNFNAWMDHIAKQLQKDYRKLYYTSKIKSNERIIQELPRKKTRNLRRVQADRSTTNNQGIQKIIFTTDS